MDFPGGQHRYAGTWGMEIMVGGIDEPTQVRLRVVLSDSIAPPQRTSYRYEEDVHFLRIMFAFILCICAMPIVALIVYWMLYPSITHSL